MFDCIIPAAGQGKRMECAGNKILLELNGKTILEHTIEVFEQNALCKNIYIASQKDEIDEITEMTNKYTKVRPIIEGGKERQYSIYNVIKKMKPTNIVMVHDAARPFITQDTIHRLYEAALEHHAAIAAVKVKDTIKAVQGDIVLTTMQREKLCLVQTPQAFKFNILKEAYDRANREQFLGTDDASLVERNNQHVYIVESDYDNIKLTTPEDMYFAEAILKKKRYHVMFRIGQGYDVHQLVEGRPLMIGGIEIPHDKGLLGHSDADVLLHAITDAVLGAVALGDIGKFFPDDDPKYKGADSKILLRDAYQHVLNLGYEIGNIDATIIAEKPKFRPHIDAIRASIANVLNTDVMNVNVKATTNEKMGYLGRQEGMQAQAVVLLKESSKTKVSSL